MANFMSMPGVGLIGFLIIGIIAGFIAEKVMAANHGLLMNLVVATIGAIILLFVWGKLRQQR